MLEKSPKNEYTNNIENGYAQQLSQTDEFQPVPVAAMDAPEKEKIRLRKPRCNKLLRMTALFILLALLGSAAPACAAAVPTAQTLAEFVIVYPNSCGQASYAYNAAVLLQEKLLQKTGIKIPVRDDSRAAAANEILVGNTVRSTVESSVVYETVQSDEYYLSVSDRVIALSGENQMVGAAVQEFVSRCVQADGSIEAGSYHDRGRKMFYAHSDLARRVIYLIADGAGPEHYRWYHESVSPAYFSGDDLPVQGMLKTDSFYGETTDSAAAATALACGYKTANGVVGMNPEQTQAYRNIRELFRERGWLTAVMTTDDITGATPSGFTAHTASRGNEAEIRRQQAQLLDEQKITALEGSLDDDNALSTVQTFVKQHDSTDGVFLMYEEAFIDKKSHNNDTEQMLAAVARFDAVVKYCMVTAAADSDTLLIVTSDHETGGVQYDAQDGFSFTESGHTSADVRIMAMGPGAEYFQGKTMENTSVPAFLAQSVLYEKLGDETAYEPVGSHVHTLAAYAQAAATCRFAGQSAYRCCTTCGRCFSDEDATREVSLTELYVPKLAHSFADGRCVQCGILAHSSIRVVAAANAVVTADRSDADFGETVTVRVRAEAGYEFQALRVTDAQGSIVPLQFVSKGVYTFSMPDSNTSVAVLTFAFADVKQIGYAYDAVRWAVQNGITQGTSQSTFSPDDACTRAQMVTLLWRAAGAPKPVSESCAFTDVDADAYYMDAVVWAVGEGIALGTSENTFSPDEPVSRAQAVSFLWRTAKSPQSSAQSSFDDVAEESAYFYGAVVWAYENGITLGTAENLFSPNVPCTRGQIVTFLFRQFAHKPM